MNPHTGCQGNYFASGTTAAEPFALSATGPHQAFRSDPEKVAFLFLSDNHVTCIELD